MTELRRIFQTKTTSQGEIRDLLQMIFANELLTPSEELWLVSPWISDIPILDNRMGGFDAINPEWKGREIRLTEVLLQLMSVGSKAFIVTISPTDVDTNRYFVNRLSSLSEETGLTNKKIIIEVPKPEDFTGLHYKGILTARGFLEGSMNISHNGLKLNDEQVTYDINRERITDARVHFEETHGEGS
ncbi:phospholipase D-like domain-containing protein DpdK [Rhodospirillales bacterium]|nr:phospholipase D-like domain-containing protein DpdK [Rhodospirillales bacterium]